MFHRTYLGLGSNLGDRAENIKDALIALARVGVVRKVSGIYETEPVGEVAQPAFYNAVALLETPIAPRALLSKLKAIEGEIGRTPGGPRWGPRVIDLDILSFDDLIRADQGLTIPHPEMEKRRFVLDPLSEIAPGWVHPESKKSVEVLLKECSEQKCMRLERS